MLKNDRRDIVVEILKRAADCPGLRPRNRFPLHHRGDGRLKFIRAAVVLQASGSIEHGSFRSHRRVRSPLQLTIRIPQRSARESELSHVIFDSPFIFIRIGIDQVEGNMPALKFLRDSPEFRRVLIGQRAIGSGEQEYLDVPRNRRRPAEQEYREALHRL